MANAYPPPQVPPMAYPPQVQQPPMAFQSPPSVPTAPAKKIITERRAFSTPGLLGLIFTLAIIAGGVYCFVIATQNGDDGLRMPIIGSALCLVGFILLCSAFTIVQPGDTKVIQFLGSYIGTVRATGLRMTVPLTTRKKVSIKVRNFETREIKVNDAQGNPVIIAAIIVWQVSDTAEATFQVEQYQQFVIVQSEAALRHVATIHPYDNAATGEPTLRGSTDIVARELAAEVRERVDVAGVNVIETRISSLSYAPEIASAMLQRQQAEAILAARAKIVEGAVSMVESALTRIEAEGIVELDDERKAAMVSNLLVVLCSDSRATPTINTGSLYT